MEEATVIKSGEVCIQVQLSRGVRADKTSGLTVSVQALPRVEDFIRSLGTGETTDVRTIGRHWSPIEKEGHLLVYNLNTNIGIQSQSYSPYRIDRPGWPILEAAHGGQPMHLANLSFLRLVGISEGPGVSFGVKGVFTLEHLRQMRDLVMEASRQFYISYLKPVQLSYQVIPDQTGRIPMVSGQEMNL